MTEDLKNNKYVIWLYDVTGHAYNSIYQNFPKQYFDIYDIYNDYSKILEMKNIKLLDRPDVIICKDGAKLSPELKAVLGESCCTIVYVSNKPNLRETENMVNHVFEFTSDKVVTNEMKGRNPVTVETTKEKFSIKKITELIQMANVRKIMKVVKDFAKDERNSMDIISDIEKGKKISSINIEYLRKVGNRLNSFINLKDNYTYGHCQRVAKYTEVLARGLELSNEDREKLILSAELHDIGKLVLPTAVINKTSKLNDSEFEWMKRHTSLGSVIFPDLQSTNVYGGIRYHHEKFDGSGYEGLKGSEIPFFGQIIAIADSFDAMTSQRSYNKVKSAEEAIQDLIQHKGSWYNPELVDIFVTELLKDKKIMHDLEVAKAIADQNYEASHEKDLQRSDIDKTLLLKKGGM